MCDLAYVNLLREKVRQLKAEEKRVATYGITLHERFTPWVMARQARDPGDHHVSVAKRTIAADGLR